MKLYKKLLIIFLLLFIFIYVCNITLLPDSIILIQGETLNLNTIYGLTLNRVTGKETVLQASSNLNKSKINEIGKINVSLNLFQQFKVKDMTVSVIPKTSVIPLGRAVGMKLYTKGILVVGMSEIEGKKPYESSGLQEGDRIIEIDNQSVESTEDLMNTVNASQGKEIQIKYMRDEATNTTSIVPIKTR